MAFVLFLSAHKRLNFSVSFILSETMKAKLAAFVFINGFKKAGMSSPNVAKLLSKTSILTLAWKINLQVSPRWALYMLSSRWNYMLNNLTDVFTKSQWEYLSIKTLLMVLYERGKFFACCQNWPITGRPRATAMTSLCFNFVLFIKATFYPWS